jgi:hypothetical protein
MKNWDAKPIFFWFLNNCFFIKCPSNPISRFPGQKMRKKSGYATRSGELFVRSQIFSFSRAILLGPFRCLNAAIRGSRTKVGKQERKKIRAETCIAENKPLNLKVITHIK